MVVDNEQKPRKCFRLSRDLSYVFPLSKCLALMPFGYQYEFSFTMNGRFGGLTNPILS